MRTKLVVGLLVLGLAVSGLGVFGVTGNAAATGQNPCPEATSVSNTVSWTTVHRFLRISIANPNIDFGEIDGLADTAAKANANTLTIESNINWSISAAITGTAGDHLTVNILRQQGRRWVRATTGTRNATLRVDYHLRNLLQMAPGTHIVTVTFTATPR